MFERKLLSLRGLVSINNRRHSVSILLINVKNISTWIIMSLLYKTKFTVLCVQNWMKKLRKGYTERIASEYQTWVTENKKI